MHNEIDTIGKLISTARGRIRVVNSDSKFTNKFIYSVIEDHLGWLLKRESDKMKLIQSDYLFQTKKCVEVIDTPAADDACGVKTKCTVRRTRDKLPRIYEDSDGVIIKSVYTIDGSEDYTPIKITEYMRKLKNPLSKYDNTKYYFYNNGYLYFPSLRKRDEMTVKKLMVKGYFRTTVINECEMSTQESAQARCVSKLDEVVRVPEYIKGELKRFINEDLVGALKIPTDVVQNKDENKQN